MLGSKHIKNTREWDQIIVDCSIKPIAAAYSPPLKNCPDKTNPTPQNKKQLQQDPIYAILIYIQYSYNAAPSLILT